MSEASTDRVIDRPAEVTDPLLWDLAAAVADAHQPDAERVCASPSCVGAAWPCAAWNAAQEGLGVARRPRPDESPGAARRPLVAAQATDGQSDATAASRPGSTRLVAAA
ncbi:hypothetical protein [Micromonospora sp. DT31]|uniref:hypothetical protein n=1 Tax=Micromonospora sp. DT31 TaxID=3393434 RepID=UPI003CFA15F9